MCGYCFEEIAIRLRHNERVALLSNVEAAPFEIDMLIQEHDDITAIESVATTPVNSISLACRNTEITVLAGRPLDRPVAVHAILDGWRPDLPASPDTVAQAVRLLSRFAVMWPSEEDDDTRMAMAGLIMPSLFAAHAIIRQHGSPSDVAIASSTILNMQLPFVPSPEGWELWLQRRMVLTYYDRCGWDGLLASYSRTIRPMLFIYLVLRRRLPDDFKGMLRDLAGRDGRNFDSCNLKAMLSEDSS